jgi:hypothetical protein
VPARRSLRVREYLDKVLQSPEKHGLPSDGEQPAAANRLEEGKSARISSRPADHGSEAAALRRVIGLCFRQHLPGPLRLLGRCLLHRNPAPPAHEENTVVVENMSGVIIGRVSPDKPASVLVMLAKQWFIKTNCLKNIANIGLRVYAGFTRDGQPVARRVRPEDTVRDVSSEGKLVLSWKVIAVYYE